MNERRFASMRRLSELIATVMRFLGSAFLPMATCMLAAAQPPGQDAPQLSRSVAQPALQERVADRRPPLKESLAAAGMSAATQKQLEGAKILDVSELRRRVLTGDKLIASLPKQDQDLLRRLSVLTLLSLDVQLNAALAKQNINSLRDVVNLTPAQIIKYSAGKLDEPGARQYLNRAVAVHRSVKQQAVQYAALCRNPVFSKRLPPGFGDFCDQLRKCAPPTTGSGTGPSTPPPSNCTGECDALTDAFSPSVYLLYLLDFVTKSFGPNLDDLQKVNGRFYQDFDAVPVSQDASDVDSYVRYSNEVLLNLIAAVKGIPWKTDAEHESARKNIINAFRAASGPIRDEPRADPDVLLKLFDSYTQQLGILRRDVLFARTLSKAYQENYAKEHGVAASDLVSIGKMDDEISVDAIDDLRRFTRGKDAKDQGLLYRWHSKRTEEAVRQEFISGIQDGEQIGFSRFYSSYRADETDVVFKGLFQRYGAAELSDEKFLDLRERAKTCVTLGHHCLACKDCCGRESCAGCEDCPACGQPPSQSPCPGGNEYLGKPLTPLRAYFIYFATTHPGHALVGGKSPKVFAQDRLSSITADLLAERHKQLVTDDCGGDVKCCQALSQAGGAGCQDCGSCRAAKNEQKAQSYAQERLSSEELFEAQLSKLAEALFDPNNQDFKTEVAKRTEEAWRSSAAKAETGFHAKIRTNLLAITLHELSSKNSPFPPSLVDATGATLLTDGNLQRLADHLFLDLTIAEDARTTPLAAAIGRIHSFVQAVRLGRAKGFAGAFNADVWGWLQSYGTWHAGLMVTANASNFLIPEVRRNRTPTFDSVTSNDVKPEDMQGQYAEALQPLATLRVIGSTRLPGKTPDEGRVLVIGLSATGDLYDAQLSEKGTWRLWRQAGKLKGNLNWRDVVVLWNADSDGQPERAFLLAWHVKPGLTLLNPNDPSDLSFRFAAVAVKDGVLSMDNEGEWKRIEQLEDQLLPPKSAATLRVFRVQADPATYQIDVIPLGKAWRLEIGGEDAKATGPETLQVPAYQNLTGIAFDPESTLWLGCGTGGLRLYDATDPNPLQMPNATCEPVGFGIGVLGERLRIFYGLTNGRLQVADVQKRSGLIPSGEAKYSLKAVAVGPVGNAFAKHLLPLSNRIALIGETPDGTIFTDAIPGQGVTALGPVLYLTYRSLLPGATDSRPSIETAFGADRVRTSSELLGTRRDSGVTVVAGASGGPDVVMAARVGYLSPQERYKRSSPADPARVYLDEYFLHIPMLVSGRLNEDGHFDDARKWLSKAFDPMVPADLEKVYPWLAGGGTSSSEIGRWLEDPFDPYALADQHRETYRSGLILGYLETILNWADRLFTQDTTESVNRARGLYRLASNILDLSELPGECAVDFHSLLTDKHLAGMSAGQRVRLTDSLRAFGRSLPKSAIPQVRQILNSPRSPDSKVAALNALATESQPKAKKLALVRAERDQHELCFRPLGDQVLAEADPQEVDLLVDAADGLGSLMIGNEFEGLDLRFCVPQNPLVSVLRWRIESNLAKIRQNRNFAGLPRQLQTYATPVDPKKLVKAAAAGNLDFEELAAILSQPPPIYRYSYLVERAKQLAQTAQQFQNSMVASIKEGDEAEYRVIQARQDAQLEKANVSLQALRVNEASHGLTLAHAQSSRAELQYLRLVEWLEDPISGREQAALWLMVAAAGLDAAAGGLHIAAAVVPSFDPGKGSLSSLAAASSAFAAASSTTAQLLSTWASYDRREDEWELQRDLASEDMKIAGIGITLADDRIDITSKERDIAEMRVENANDTVELLQDRFFNGALYRWMKKNLKQLYREQLNFAISTAKAAQRALEFDRQASLDFIGYDYWDDEKQGLLGSERLLKDIEKMDDYRLATATRKKEIEKTISLASAVPAEFQKFRKTGVLDVSTIMPWFDRDFPGHFMRLIHDLNVTVLALVPPNEGIHATLSHNGLSRVMSGPPFEQFATIHRLPESVALSGAYKATGLFELRPEDPMLLPFEGSGVDTSWRLEMPKGANRFNYDSIYDVLFTIRYTALEDRDYRGKVLQGMQQDDAGFVKVGSVRYFSLRNDFPDQWYQFYNPVVGLDETQYWNPTKSQGLRQPVDEGKPQRPYTVALEMNASDFVPNEARHSIKKLTVAMQTTQEENLASDQNWCLPITVSLRSTRFNKVELTDEKFTSGVNAVAGSPFGAWTMAFGSKCGVGGNSLAPASGDLSKELKKRVKDIWLIVEYDAAVHYNR